MGLFTSRLCAGLALVLGIELIIGWMLRNEAMLRILPSSNTVSFNTAVGFVLCGAALLASSGTRLFAWRQGVAVVVGVGAVAILFENVTDIALGIDWESLHRPVQDGSPRPGRVAPNTCVAFILLSVVLYQRTLADTTVQRWLMRVCGMLLMGVVASGVVGLMLDPTLMFGWYRFNRMAAPTAFGLGLLAVSAFAEYRAKRALQALTQTQHQRRVMLSGALMLLATGLAATVTTAVVFANHQLQVINDQLRATLGGQIKLVEVVISQAKDEAESLNQLPLLHAMILKTSGRRQAAELLALQNRLDQFRKQGFVSLQLFWTDGSLAATAGDVGRPAVLAMPLLPAAPGQLLWRQGTYFYKHVTQFTAPDGRAVAQLVTEQPLQALSSSAPMGAAPDAAPDAASTSPAGSQGEVVCGRLDGRPACFPSAQQPRPGQRNATSGLMWLPLEAALAGKSRVQTAQNPEGVNVVLAYSPIGNTGLVMLTTVQATQLYQPIGHLLTHSLAVLAVALCIGVWLLRATIGPLLAAMAQAEARAVESRRRLQSITDQMPALIGFVSVDLKYEFMNATYARWFDRPVSTMLGRPMVEHLGNEMFAKSLPNIRKALAGEVVEFTRQTNSSLASFPAHVSVTYIPDRTPDGTVLGFNVLAFDATQQHQHESELQQLANHDSLTGLANRRLFHDRLAHALAQGRRHRRITALIYLDIDHFKRINDTLGHEQGDHLLVAVAQRLSSAVRASDTVARLGGDEFVVLMEDLRAMEDAELVAAKILAAIRAPIDLAGVAHTVTTSLGLTHSDEPDISAEELIRRSDAALYAAKAAGRNRYHVYGAAEAKPEAETNAELTPADA